MATDKAGTDEARLLGRRIKELRKKRGLTQEELAERCHLHYKFLGGIERASVNTTLTVLKKIAAGLDVSVADLFRYELHSGSPAQIRKQLVARIRRCSDSDVLLLYRVCCSL
jgi:transcriptional regulator with XRE-family HTH domain